jgi:hypothetical protein
VKLLTCSQLLLEEGKKFYREGQYCFGGRSIIRLSLEMLMFHVCLVQLLVGVGQNQLED